MPQENDSLRESLRLLELPELWVLVLVLLPGLALVAWLGYRGERTLSGAARGTLASLRFCALAVLMVVLFRPVLVERREDIQPAEVILLVDDSASMRRSDAYAGDAERRAQLATFAPGPLSDATRLDLARVALERELVPGLRERGYVPRAFAFSSELTPLRLTSPAGGPAGGDGSAAVPGTPSGTPPGAETEMLGHGHATHLGDALAGVLNAHRGRHVTDIVVLSDGRQNGGSSASLAARTAAATGIPVHTVVIGDTRPERNAVVELVEAPASALEGDEIAILVRVLGRGTQSGDVTQVLLSEYEPGAGPDAEPRLVAEQQVRLTEAGERVALVAGSGPADQRTGDRRFRVEIIPLDGETLLDDNALEVAVHVTPEKVRVLYVEGYPRWEYRRLALDMLKRSDKNIEFQAFLLSATPDFQQESTKGLPSLTSVPTDRKTLLDNYDVVILGDVNPWSISPDPERAEEFLKSLVEFVERGGGLLFIAGEYDNPRAFVSTPLEPLFPVVLDAAEMANPVLDTREEYRPRLEDPANPHEIVRLVPDVETNRRLWEEPEGLRGFYWFMPTSRAKPGSTVLLRHPTEGSRQYGPYPLMVAGYYPSGRTLFLGIDSTWMWQYHFGHRYHERFWRNAIRWLALGRMRSGDRRYRLELARNSYNLGDRVSIEARVLDEDYRPSEAAVQEIRWSPPDGRPVDLKLPSVPGRQGLFRGSIETERPGLHRAWIESAGARITTAEFEVVLPSLENQDPSPDPALMREVSAISHGRGGDLLDLEQLWGEFPGDEERREPVSARLEDLWDSWTTLLLALAILAAEWILRKRWELV